MFRQKFLSNQFAQTKLWRENKYRKFFEETSLPRILCREIRTENIRRVIPVQPNFEEKLLPTSSWRENCLPRIFWREITAKKYVTKFSAKESLKRHSLPKAWKEESPRKKWKHVCQNRFDNFSTKNSLKRNLYQTNCSSNLYRKSIGRNISTTNSLKGNLYKTIFKRNLYWKIFQEKIYKTNI